MDLRRLRHGEWIAGVSGAALLVAMFLDWYTLDVPGRWPAANAWQAFAAVDVFLALAAVAGIALALTAATQRSPAVPQAVGALTVPIAFIAAILVVLRALDPPGWESVVGGPPALFHAGLPVSREIGLYIGVVATLGVLVGAWRSIGDQSFPRAAAPQVDVTPLPAPKPRSEPHDDE
jgi:hypothetical protein